VGDAHIHAGRPTDGWTDMTRLIGAFGDHASAPRTICRTAREHKSHSVISKAFKFSTIFEGPPFALETLQSGLGKRLSTNNAQLSLLLFFLVEMGPAADATDAPQP
jgi:hypothetical protein